MPTKYGDDFHIGDTFLTPAVTVTESHVVAFTGLTGDFYPLHVDAVYSAASQFGERLVQGPFVFGLAVGLVTLSGILADSAVAWLGADSVRMLSPVKIGDTVHVSAEVKTLKRTKTPTKGIQTWVYSVVNQHGTTVLTFDHQLMVHLRATGSE